MHALLWRAGVAEDRRATGARNDTPSAGGMLIANPSVTPNVPFPLPYDASRSERNGAGRHVALSINAPEHRFLARALKSPLFGHIANAGGWASNDEYPLSPADVNGDGRSDIVGCGRDGVYVALANDHGSFETPTAEIRQFGTAPVAGNWASESSQPRAVSDVDGGGLADIVGFGEHGPLSRKVP